jgi:hypothetical protein
MSRGFEWSLSWVSKSIFFFQNRLYDGKALYAWTKFHYVFTFSSIEVQQTLCLRLIDTAHEMRRNDIFSPIITIHFLSSLASPLLPPPPPPVLHLLFLTAVSRGLTVQLLLLSEELLKTFCDRNWSVITTLSTGVDLFEQFFSTNWFF